VSDISSAALLDQAATSPVSHDPASIAATNKTTDPGMIPRSAIAAVRGVKFSKAQNSSGWLPYDATPNSGIT
jgi:hypothetical protein